MNKKIIAFIAVVAVVAQASVVLAAAWTNKFTVTSVQGGHTDSKIYIYGAANVQSCSVATLLATTSNSNVEQIKDLATAAFLSGRKLNCNINGCEGSYQRVTACELSN